MAQWLRLLATLPGDLNSVPSIHMMTHSHLVFQEVWCLILTCTRDTNSAHTYIQAKALMHKICRLKIIFKRFQNFLDFSCSHTWRFNHNGQWGHVCMEGFYSNEESWRNVAMTWVCTFSRHLKISYHTFSCAHCPDINSGHHPLSGERWKEVMQNRQW